MKFLFQDLIFLHILLMLGKINAEPSNMIILPNGHVIPDPSTYKYFEEHTKGTIVRQYVLLEIKPTTAIMCPKDYSIGKVSQVLLVNSNGSDLIGKIPFQEAPQIATVGQINIPDAACPRLFKCLAYQACLFKFGNEFCGHDSAPTLRKFLQVNITCYRDDYNPMKDNVRSNFVLYMTYKSRLEDGVRDYSRIVVKYNEINEDEVFNGHCPPLDEALQQGYSGSCMDSQSSTEVVAEQLWSILGRASTEKCREELTQAFCAFHYNSQGLCIPPIFHEKNKAHNFRSLPKVGSRPTEMHKQLMNTHHTSMIPAKLAFLLLLHKDVPAAVDLLELIYRPYNWYVIHVDSRAPAVRAELYQILKQMFRGAKNIVVLAEERSFPTSWASYDIVRAELEAFEELLRRGVWDFAINLSGADYPLRDVDDLAAALGPYKGLNFLPFVQMRERNESADDSNLFKKAFYACNGYVYNIKAIQGLPNPDDLKIYNSPQWGVFSRDFVSYLVNGTARPENLNKFQFYLQTHVVPDESYIPTLLMNSKFKSTVRTGFVHTSKEFASDNINNLCRHSNDADFCGQGPATYDTSDIPELFSASHRSFFARKFLTKLTDKTRNMVRDLSQGGYYKFFDHHLPHQILKNLAENAMSVMYNKTFPSSMKLKDILQLRVLPSLVPHNPCCQSLFLLRFRKIIDHIFWLDFSFVNTDDGEVKDARVILEPALNGRVCYPDGHLKMAFVTPWTRDVLHDSQNDEQPVRMGLDQTLPLPYGPAYMTDISAILFFSRMEEDSPSCSNEKSYGIPLTFPSASEDLINPVIVLLQLVSPDQRIKCVRTEIISWDLKNKEDQVSPYLIHPIMINCGILEPGPWQILLSQVNVSNGRIYNFPFYLLDYFNEENLNQQLTDINHLWKVKDVSLLFHGKPNDELSIPRKLHTVKKFVYHNRRTYSPKVHKRNFSQFGHPDVMYIAKNIITMKKIPSEEIINSTHSPVWTLRLIVTVIITYVLIILINIWTCRHSTAVARRQRFLLGFLLAAILTFLQIIFIHLLVI